MKKLLSILAFCFLVCSCNRGADPVLAEVYNTRLYASEIISLLPEGLNREDSLQMAVYLIDEWVKKQILLQEAEKSLSIRDKNFEKEIDDFRKDLLLNTYYKKLASDTSHLHISDGELTAYMEEFEFANQEERGIVKLNYVKLSPNSKVLKELKSILFDDHQRIMEKAKIEKLCGDSLEYFIEDHTWLYFDDFKNDIPLDINEDELAVSPKRNIEKVYGNSLYLIVFLEYKTTPDQRNESEIRDMARSMLIQQKKTRMINDKVDALYQKALKEGKIVR